MLHELCIMWQYGGTESSLIFIAWLVGNIWWQYGKSGSKEPEPSTLMQLTADPF